MGMVSVVIFAVVSAAAQSEGGQAVFTGNAGARPIPAWKSRGGLAFFQHHGPRAQAEQKGQIMADQMSVPENSKLLNNCSCRDQVGVAIKMQFRFS
jgi:hypothetical protein